MDRHTSLRTAFVRRVAVKQLWKYFSALGVALMLSGMPAFSQQGKPVVSCESLAKLTLPNATITMAETVAAGTFKFPARNPGAAPQGAQPGPGGPNALPGPGAPGGPSGPGTPDTSKWPEFCRIAATLTPTSDSDIRIEVWLPADNWNGKFEGVGNSGLGGSIQLRNLLTPMLSGYAVAATDTGHQDNTLSFIPGHPEKLIDYAYRADHEMTVKAKALIKAYYGADPKHSYWVGCSLGGVEALTEAYRYPEDYDGIVAGSPVNPFTLWNAAQIWPAYLNLKYPDAAIPAGKYKMINDAAIKACAGPAGLKQGLIDDPLSCKFDPAVLLCKDADAPDCLTAPQIDFLRKLYAGPVNPRTGESIHPGYPVGAEMLLAQNGGTTPANVAVELYKNMVMQDPSWDWKTMNFDTVIAKAEKETAPIIDVPPNLNGFLNRGGKLMIYIGGAEQKNPASTVAYYKTVLRNDPGKESQVRLFVNPGVGHCGGGTGCDTFEKLDTIAQWVESGKAPDQILSSKVSQGKIIRTRPLCAYPAIAKYKGSGNLDDAASFVCAK